MDAISTTIARVSRSAFQNNLSVIRKAVRSRAEIIAVIKANAYGHGMFPSAPILSDLGVRWFAVARSREAEELVLAKIPGKILILGSVESELPERGIALTHRRVIHTVGSLHEIERISGLSRELGRKLNVHLKIDSGMGRRGIRWDQIREFLGYWRENRRRLRSGIEISGLMTHFAQSSVLSDPFTRLQIRRFTESQAALAEIGIRPKAIHAANSGAIFNYPEAHFTHVRPGISIYGLYRRPGLHPVLTLESQVTQLEWVKPGDSVGYGRLFRAARPTLVGLVPCGYADGYRIRYREVPLLVRVGKRVAPVRILGRITMDQLMIDLTSVADPIAKASVSRHTLPMIRVYFFGNPRQTRGVATAFDVAESADQIVYEVVTGLSDRIDRVDSW